MRWFRALLFISLVMPCVLLIASSSSAAATAEEEARQAIESAKSAGFTVSDTALPWEEAMAFCASRGERLPLKDDFGDKDDNWPSGAYWTGTEANHNTSYIVGISSFSLVTINNPKRNNFPVFCIPETFKAEKARKEQEALKSAGIIALSDTDMTWEEARAWCASRGGRLPLFDSKTATIDGFGKQEAAWPTGMPDYKYWVGTEAGGSLSARIVSKFFDKVQVFDFFSEDSYRVVCVP
jgi:hypothetical protein